MIFFHHRIVCLGFSLETEATTPWLNLKLQERTKMKLLVTMIFKLAVTILRILFSLVFGKTQKSLPKPFETSIYVIDGDTVGIPGTDMRIRLHGIDAPEKRQKQGAAATQFLKNLALKHKITVKPLEYDKYGRIVATLFRGDNVNLNASMVAHGYALAEVRYTRAYVKLQKEARRSKLGLWKDGGIQDPRAWRNTHA
jgi:micrococcal nuclease